VSSLTVEASTRSLNREGISQMSELGVKKAIPPGMAFVVELE